MIPALRFAFVMTGLILAFVAIVVLCASPVLITLWLEDSYGFSRAWVGVSIIPTLFLIFLFIGLPQRT